MAQATATTSLPQNAQTGCLVRTSEDRPVRWSSLGGIAGAILVLLLPSFTTLSPLDDVLTPQVALLCLASLFCIGVAVRGCRVRYRVDTVQFGLVAIAGSQVAAFVLSSDHTTSLLGMEGNRQGVITQLAYLVVFVLGYRTFAGTGSGRKLILLLTMGSVPVVAYGMIRLFHLDWVRWSGGVKPEALFSTVGGPNELAGYFLLVVPCALYVAASSRWPVSLLSSVLAGSLGFLLILTGSRAAIVSLAIVIPMFVVVRRISGGKRLSGIGHRGWGRGRGGYSRPLILVVGLLFIAFLALVTPVNELYQRPRSPSNVLDTTFAARVELWAAAGHSLVYSPLFGYGQDSVPVAVETVGRQVKEFEHLASDWSVSSFHNFLLDKLSGTGLIGFAAYVGLFLVLARLVVRRLRGLDAQSSAIVIVASISMASFMLHSMFNPVYVVNEAIFWLLAGLLYGVVRRHSVSSVLSGRSVLSQATEVAEKAWRRDRLSASEYAVLDPLVIAVVTITVFLSSFYLLGSPWPKPLGVPGPLPQPPPYPLSPFPTPFGMTYQLPELTAHIMYRVIQLVTLVTGLQVCYSRDISMGGMKVGRGNSASTRPCPLEAGNEISDQWSAAENTTRSRLCRQ